MGTRGFITFAVDGELKTAYNHWDSYPDGLGVKVLEWLRDATKDPAALRRNIKALRVVQGHEKPAPADVEHLKPWTDLGVGEQSTDDWYCLLRGTQGEPEAMVAAGVIEDASGFPADSLFAEWGYVVDLDGDGLFEVYEGFQKSPHSKGRFASLPFEKEHRSDQYYPVALRASWPLAALPDDKTFLAATQDAEDEDA